MKSLIAVFLLSLLAAGCTPSRDTAHPAYFKAAKCREAGDYEAAARQLRNFLAARPESAAGHLAMASLCDENLRDLPAALYHYREYLRLAPDSEDNSMVRAWLGAATERYRAELNKQVPGTDAVANAGAQAAAEAEPKPQPVAAQTTDDSAKDELIASLRTQNQDLKRRIFNQSREIAALRGTAAPVPPPAPIAENGGERLYTVRAGDTLGLIARRFYGASYKFRPIMEANRLTGSSTLHIGQVLRIPAWKE